MPVNYVYVDGESHFLRSQEAWRSLHGPTASLEHVRTLQLEGGEKLQLVIPEAKVFWSYHLTELSCHRRVYATSVSAVDDDSLHDIKVRMREIELEPILFKEPRQLAKQREDHFNTRNVIEKAKRVDAALSVRILEDAYSDNFDDCLIYTSDVDCVPVIEAVRRRGKRVIVYGYRNGLGKRSPLLHVPDEFVDLEKVLKSRFVCRRAAL